MTDHQWKIWNGWGPSRLDGLMRCERIGPPGKGGIFAPCSDISGTLEDIELVAMSVNQCTEARAALRKIIEVCGPASDAGQIALDALGGKP